MRNEIHNGYQALERFLNVVTMPSFLGMVAAAIVTLMTVPDGTVQAGMIVMLACVFMVCQTVVRLVQAMRPAEVVNITVRDEYAEEDDYEFGHFGDADEVDDFYGR